MTIRTALAPRGVTAPRIGPAQRSGGKSRRGHRAAPSRPSSCHTYALAPPVAALGRRPANPPLRRFKMELTAKVKGAEALRPRSNSELSVVLDEERGEKKQNIFRNVSGITLKKKKYAGSQAILP